MKGRFHTLMLLLVFWIATLKATEALMSLNKATECTASGIVPEPTSAFEIDGEAALRALPQSQYWIMSKIICASVAGTKASTAFDYEDGDCMIYGAGLGDKKNIIYRDIPQVAVENLEEVSRLKPTTASPYLEYWADSYAVDGMVDTNHYNSNQGIVNAWWIVDLQEVRTIHQVQIYTRQDCCWERFHHAEIRVGQTLNQSGNLSSYALMSTYEGPYDKSQGWVICSHLQGVTGRFLSIQKVGNDEDHLQLVEVKVYATKKTY